MANEKQVTFTTEEFEDFLDYYSDFVLLWQHYNHKGRIKEGVNFDMVKDALFVLSRQLDAIMKEAGDRDSYHEEAKKLFVTYMEWNEYFLDEADPNVVFYESRWTMADIMDAVESLKEQKLIPSEIYLDYGQLSKVVKKGVFDDHTDANEAIMSVVEQYCCDHAAPEFSKESNEDLAGIVLLTLNPVSQKYLYKGFLKYNKIEKLTTAQIIEIICRTGMFNVHDFEKNDTRIVKTILDVIGRLSELSVKLEKRVDITNEFPGAAEKGLRICYNNDSSEFEIWDGKLVYSYYDEGEDKTGPLKQKIQKEIDSL